MENQPKTNETPWTEDLMTMFGFGKKEEAATAASSITTPSSPWEDTNTLWEMWKPKPPVPRPAYYPQSDQGYIRSMQQKAPTSSAMSFEQVFDGLVQAESRGKHTDASGGLTTSNVGAKGITQVMPASGKDPGYGVAPLKNDSEAEYLRFGKDLLKAYTKEFGGDIAKGLAAYNYGPGNVKKVIAKYGEDWKNNLPKETSNYLKKILG